LYKYTCILVFDTLVSDELVSGIRHEYITFRSEVFLSKSDLEALYKKKGK